MPTTANEIASVVNAYDAVFIIGGRSLITILYSEGEAIPETCAVYQLSADMNELGRTYATRLSVMGDIKLSLKELLPKRAAPGGKQIDASAAAQSGTR